MKPHPKTAYLAVKGFERHLIQELEGIREIHGRLILTDRPAKKVFWAQNIWLNPVVLSVQSIADGARQLKALQRNWWLYSTHLHRRASLIRDRLPHVSAKPIRFPSKLPQAPLGSWTLLDSNSILASPQCSSLFPNGEVVFLEDRQGPPNRAYLKLWEVLTLLQHFPHKGDFCIDVGGSPGGWTWAIQKLGGTVLSVDRSPLNPKVFSLPRVKFQKCDAFSLVPEMFVSDNRMVDWLFSDIVCYPEKLYDWVILWTRSGICKNIVCTLKFKDNYDYKIVEKFTAIPGSQMAHLYHNKHELTWVFPTPSGKLGNKLRR